eukprot:TRINITY_DN1993_c0_g1_i17.p1 TRINITY_DN1993_c0_g1~~TRINITY_DN1993_c0_g1_i17.p1  ORF type:complete len:234 (-),score=49.43 TRINITY_DN1993_c0_g1_i17:264-863(-)
MCIRDRYMGITMDLHHTAFVACQTSCDFLFSPEDSLKTPRTQSQPQTLPFKAPNKENESRKRAELNRLRQANTSHVDSPIRHSLDCRNKKRSNGRKPLSPVEVDTVTKRLIFDGVNANGSIYNSQPLTVKSLQPFSVSEQEKNNKSVNPISILKIRQVSLQRESRSGSLLFMRFLLDSLSTEKSQERNIQIIACRVCND